MCPHADTTTIAFLYGEAPLSHAEHVAACADCEAVARDHEAVVTALGPALGALRRAPRRRTWPWVGAGFALAAAALLVVGLTLPVDVPLVEAERPSIPLDPGLDLALDDLDDELASLEQELL